MKQQEIFKKVGNILKELNEQYEYLGSVDVQQLNDLELELFVANAHFLAEHSDVLRKLNQQNLPPAPAAKEEPRKKHEEKYFEPVVQPAKPAPEPIIPSKQIEPEPGEVEDKPVPHIDLAANGADDDFSVVRREEPGVIKHELILDESQNWEDEEDTGFEIEEVQEPEEPATEQRQVKAPEPPQAKEPEPEPERIVPPPAEVKPADIRPAETKPVQVKQEKKTLPEITAIAEDKLEAEEPLTINQKISAQLNKTARLSEQLHPHTITDLKQAINLNDKLLYIKDLFNGYNLAYSEAIDILNRFQTFEEAEDFLTSNYATKNHWESKQATVEKFYALLRRRFA